MAPLGSLCPPRPFPPFFPELSPPIINLCLPPPALCSHMHASHASPHKLTLSCAEVKSYSVQVVEHEKKMSEMADRVLG